MENKKGPYTYYMEYNNRKSSSNYIAVIRLSNISDSSLDTYDNLKQIKEQFKKEKQVYRIPIYIKVLSLFIRLFN